MGTTQGAIVASHQATLASLRELRKRKIHRHFAGYLCVLRTAAQTNSRSNLQVNFRQFFEDFLRPGEVPEKTPYFVPFSRSESASADLSIANVAGSYAPSSLRADRPFSQVVTVSGQKNTARYALPDDHWKRALEHLAYGEKVPLVSLAIYLYRDYAIEVATGGFPRLRHGVQGRVWIGGRRRSRTLEGPLRSGQLVSRRLGARRANHVPGPG